MDFRTFLTGPRNARAAAGGLPPEAGRARLRAQGLRAWVLAGLAVAGVSWCRAASSKTIRLGLPGGRAITVDLALTPKEQEQGLMFRTSLPKDYGMLFVFPAERRLEFWMKNTWVSLDMVFIGGDKRITSIHRNVPRSYPETPDEALARRYGNGRYVLELPAGACKRYRLRKGDRLSFEAAAP